MALAIEDLKVAIEEKGAAFEALKTATEAYHAESKQHGEALAETKASLAKVNAAYDAANEAKAAAEKRLDTLEAAMQRKGNGSDGTMSTDLAEHKAAFVDYVRGKKSAGEMEIAQAKAVGSMGEMKALARSFQSGQGYLVPLDTTGRMVTAIHDSSNMRSLASVQSISTDALCGSKDNELVDAEWTGEMNAPSTSANAQVGTWKIPVHEIAAKPAATQMLIEDSSINVEQWLSRKGAEIFGLKEETAFFTGDGIARPRGIATYTPQTGSVSDVIADGSIRTVKTGVNADITDADVIVKMIERLKSGYQANAQFGMSRKIRESVRLLKQDGKFVWQAGLQAGVPDRLLGYTVNEQNDLAVAAGSIGILFGDFARTYQIVDRVGFSLIVDPYTRKPFVEFYMRRRVGGGVVNFDSMIYGQLAS